MTYRPFSDIISAISGSVNKSQLFNNTGTVIDSAVPVRLNSSGNIATVDISIENHVFGIVGLTQDPISNLSYGWVVTEGKLEDVVGFNFGDYIYLSKSGNLTNIAPSEGVGGFVSGDWVVRVGVIGKNETNPLLKDLFVSINIVGQL
jgi:hypothetical protein